MPKQTNNGLPAGVSVVGNRPGLYRLTCMIHGKRYSEYYRPTETGKKKLQSELQKAIDTFRQKVECGTLKNGTINDKSTFEQAVTWFLEIRKLNIRESTQLADKFIFEHYLIPRLGKFKLREITSPVITKLLAELLEKGGGGGRAKYAAKPEFIELMYAKKPDRKAGGFNLVARELGNGLVCPNLTGGLMDKSTPNKAVKRILNARKELPRNLHAHSLRHSFVSLLIANGLDVVNVAALAGDTIEIISKHYAHSFAERRAAAMDFVGNSFAQLGNSTTLSLTATN